METLNPPESVAPRLRRPRDGWRRAAMTALLVVVALNVAALLVRARFVAVSGPYAATTGFEEFCLYNVWKAAHGLPVYEWPHREHYLLSFYNAGFYHAYAWWTKLWQAEGSALVSSARWLSALSAIVGMAVQVHLLTRMMPGRGAAGRASAWGLALMTWLGTSFTAWTPFSVRPDIPAVALALTGFALALHARQSDWSGWWILGSLVFFGGWALKQSVVWIFVGTVLYSIWTHTGWANVLRLVVPFGVLATGMLAMGGDAYRYNLSQVPRIFAWLPGQSVKLLAQTVGLNLFFFVFAAWAWKGLVRSAGSIAPPRSFAPTIDARWWAAATVALPPLAVGGVQLTLRGSSTNNVLEGFVMVALLGSAQWLKLVGLPGRNPACMVGTLCLTTMIPLPVAQLTLAAQGIPFTTVQGVSIGNLTKLNAGQLEQRRRFAAWMETLPKPLWTRDAMLQMPWFATSGQYPAFVLNPQFEDDAAAKGVLEGAGFAEWIRRRHFACLLLSADDPLTEIARTVGYVEAPRPPGLDSLPSEFGIARPTPRLWLRTDTVR